MPKGSLRLLAYGASGATDPGARPGVSVFSGISTQRTTITKHVRGTLSSHPLSELRHAASLGAIFMVVAGCSSARPGTAVAPAAACVVGAAQPSAGDTLSLAVTTPADPAHVPAPMSPADRLVFAQLYETLIDVDCDGHAQPALAAAWTLDATRTRVTLSLRDGGRFWNGKAITASDVLAAWRSTAARLAPSARLASEVATGTTIVDDHTLIVSLPDTEWLVLSDPAIAIYVPQSTGAWPAGSGPYHIDEQSTNARSEALVLVPSAPSSDPYLTTRRMPSADPRDAIDAGADVLVTGDPVAVAYAAAHPSLATVPLPWTRTYVLVLPGAAPQIAQALLRPDSESGMLRASLARDAVHAEARGAQAPYWFQGHACGATLDTVAPAQASDGRSNRVVYRRDDDIARGLAERLVALDANTVSTGLAPDDFAAALRDGGDVAYVLDLPRVSLSSCNEFASLRSAAPWLAAGIAPETHVVPLIDTRETAIVNRRRVAAKVDWRGTLHFGGVRP